LNAKRILKGLHSVNGFSRRIAFLLLCALLAHGEVSLVGIVPPEITSGFILTEYRRIWSQLSDKPPRLRGDLEILFYTRGMAGNFRPSLPEWGGGGAIGADRIIVLVDNQPLIHNDLIRTTVHEIAHIVLNRLTPESSLPRWFHEGVAMIMAGDINLREHVVLSQAIFTGNCIPFSSIDSLNLFGRFKASLAYSQSRQAVLFLIDAYGRGILAELLEATNRNGDFWQAMQEVLRLSPEEFESLAMRHISRTYGPVFWIADTYLLWLGIVALFLFGFLATKMRNARKRALMQEEEDYEAQADKERLGQ
jgi:hypothetical protein